MAGFVSRSDVSTIIEEAYANTLLQSAVQGSTALSAFPTVNLGTKLTHLPVLATLPTAGWVTEVNDATGAKPQSSVTWQDRTLVVEELAVIIPVHEDVLHDCTAAVLDDIAQLGGQAIGKALDQAVFFGVNKPASWTSPALIPAAVSAGQAVTNVTGAANESDLVGAANKVARDIALVGWQPDTFVSSLALRYDVANIRDTLGQPIFRDDSFNGFKTFFNRNGAWDNTAAAAVIVDSSRVRIGVRQDITVKFLDQATLGTGANQINLAERDLVALRLKARFAYILGTAATSMATNAVPVGAIVPAGS